MKRIQAYLSIIDPRLLGNLKGKSAELIQIFRERNYESEDELIQRFCGKTHSKNHYSNLKSRIIPILQSLAIMSSSRGGSELKKKYDSCMKKFAIAQKFLNSGGREEGIRLIKQIHEDAVKYDFVHLLCETSELLSHDFLYYEDDIEQATLYAKQTDKYLHDYRAEKKAHYYFYQVYSRRNALLGSEDFEKAIKNVQQLQGKSIKYVFYTYRLRIMYRLHRGDYDKIVQLCEDALGHFNEKKGVYSSTFHFLYLTKGVAEIARTHHHDAEDCFARGLGYAPKNSRNDYVIRLYMTLNMLHAGKYQDAYRLYLINRQCNDKEVQMQFTIMEAYFCFLVSVGHLKIDKPFRSSKFLNQLLRKQADKKNTVHLSILIAQLLVYLVRDRKKFVTHIEFVKTYSKNLSKSRGIDCAKLLIKILSFLPKANFHAPALQQLAKKYIHALQAHPIAMGTDISIEIIPFHVLVEMLLGNEHSI